MECFLEICFFKFFKYIDEKSHLSHDNVVLSPWTVRICPDTLRFAVNIAPHISHLKPAKYVIQ